MIVALRDQQPAEVVPDAPAVATVGRLPKVPGMLQRVQRGAQGTGQPGVWAHDLQVVSEGLGHQTVPV
jgi:hypothetical protein